MLPGQRPGLAPASLGRRSLALGYAVRQLHLAARAAALTPRLRSLAVALAGLSARVTALSIGPAGPRPAAPRALFVLVSEIAGLRAAAGARGFPVPALVPPPL